MIELGNNYVLDADSNCWTLKKRTFTKGIKSKEAGVEQFVTVGYYSSEVTALEKASQLMMREKVASGEITTLSEMVAEYRKIRDNIGEMLKTAFKG